MASEPRASSFNLVAPPYHRLLALDDPRELHARGALHPGTGLLWHLNEGGWARGYPGVRRRPGGVALLVVLPPAELLGDVQELLEMVELCRPHSLLPYHPVPDPEEAALLLRRPPDDLAGEVLDYLAWRGIRIEMETRRLVAKTFELSDHLQTVRGLSRSLYLSRRALGRRFRKHGLPVPSHWLHIARILRACIELQNSDRSLFHVATTLGYSDGFSLSNQMMRLTGHRPSDSRVYLGWEWIFEAWLQREEQEGRLLHSLEEEPSNITDPSHDRDPSTEPGAHSTSYDRYRESAKK